MTTTTTKRNFKSKKKFESKRDIINEITDKVIELLEQGTSPWKKPWNGRDMMLFFLLFDIHLVFFPPP